MNLANKTLPEAAADAVIDMIVSRGLAEGDALPSSAELSKGFGVSPTVIREALAMLASRGILSRRQGREPVVAKPGHEVLASVLRLRAHHDDMGIEEFLECRAALEVQAAAMAAGRRNTGALPEHVQAMREATTDSSFNTADIAFHLELARLTANRAVEVMLASLQDVMYEVFTYGLSKLRTDRGVQDIVRVAQLHDPIIRAIRAGHPRRAAKAMALHFVFSIPELRILV